MATVRFPTNDVSRLNAVSTALETVIKDVAEGNKWVMSPTINSLKKITPLMQAKVVTAESFKFEKMGEIREKNEALSNLALYIRHGLNSISNRIERLNEPVELLSNYEISQTGLMPNFSTTPELTVIADKIIAGDAKSVAAGFSPMENPTAVEIGEINEIAKKEVADIAQADRKVDSAEEELAELRVEADDTIRDVVADLNYNLRKMDDSSRRRIMRSYGVVFRVDAE